MDHLDSSSDFEGEGEYPFEEQLLEAWRDAPPLGTGGRSDDTPPPSVPFSEVWGGGGKPCDLPRFYATGNPEFDHYLELGRRKSLEVAEVGEEGGSCINKKNP